MNAMRGGRFFFGDDQLFPGTFYFQAGNAVMGDTALTQIDSAQLKVFMTSQPEKIQLTVTQALINSDSTDSTVHYILNSKPFDLNNPPKLDVSKPCFVRIEVLDSTGSRIIMSNPIFFSSNRLVLTQIPNAPNTSISAITIFPNPAHSAFTVNWSNSSPLPLLIKLVDEAGKTIRVLVNNGIFSSGIHSSSFSTQTLSAGLYYIQFTSGQFHSSVKFIVK